MNRRREVGALIAGSLAAIALCAATVLIVLNALLATEPAAPATPEPPARGPLTGHVVMILVDGLRYDFATDAKRAPNFARHMRDDAHALVLAGHVTMTSAAVLTLGTGTRASLAQLVLNLHAEQSKENTLFDNLRTAHLTTALFGDLTWSQSFGAFDVEPEAMHEIGREPDGIDPLIAAAVAAETNETSRPAFLILHLLALDHLGHAGGTISPTYTDELFLEDAKIERFIEKMPPDVTIIGLSDHGQTDTGAHGADIASVRQTPLFALGPGIKKGVAVAQADQSDVAATIATLLGVSGPAAGQGSAITELLDEDGEASAAIACADAHRVLRIAKTDGDAETAAALGKIAAPCENGGSVEARKNAGRTAVHAFHEAASERSERAGRFGKALLCAFVLGAALVFGWFASELAPAIDRRRALGWSFLASAAALAVVGLTYGVERIVPPFHNVTRGVLFALGNASLLISAAKPSRGASLIARAPALAFALWCAGALWSYPANTQPEAFIAMVVLAIGWLVRAHGDRRVGVRESSWLLALLAFAAVVIGPFGFRAEEPAPAILIAHRWAALGLTAIVVTLWLGGLASRRGETPRAGAIAVLLAILPAIARPHLGFPIGVATFFVFVAAALALTIQKRHGLALGAGFGAFALISRDEELAAVAACVLVAELAGIAARPREDGDAKARPLAVLGLGTIAFGAAYLTRIVVTRGLDLTGMDLGAGAFGLTRAPELWVGVAIGIKYFGAALLVVAAMLPHVGRGLRVALIGGLVAGWSIRAATVGGILLACRHSYWSTFRALGDIAPDAVVALACVVAACFVVFRAPTTVDDG